MYYLCFSIGRILKNKLFIQIIERGKKFNWQKKELVVNSYKL